MSYVQDGVSAAPREAALRRVHDDPNNVANPSARPRSYDKVERGERLMEGGGLVESSMRRGSFVVDVQKAQERTELPGRHSRATTTPPARSRRQWSDSATTTDQMKRLLAVGYNGIVIGRAAMGSTRAPEFIRAVRDRTLLPTEFSQWGP
ncbi:hypothetical protein ACHAW5_011260 [Stephanodiscus triporus]|uniref:Indole-3-glycerol-phosphate synthase n=1 Tax=Stephanodiscus triporus TaxID=2934178 RepID=A0ABD3PPF0_9STRA